MLAMIAIVRHAMWMHQFTHKIFFLVAVLIPALIFAISYYFYTPVSETHCVARNASGGQMLKESGSLNIGTTTISVEIARAASERKQGLSGRSSLEQYHGMLFIFDHPERYGFWMPDMCFAIDIIWIDADWRIIDISKNVTPESYPELFTPTTPALYVLEVGAGTAQKFGWEKGILITLRDPQYK